jgi:hypothetical protein
MMILVSPLTIFRTWKGNPDTTDCTNKVNMIKTGTGTNIGGGSVIDDDVVDLEIKNLWMDRWMRGRQSSRQKERNGCCVMSFESNYDR